MQLPSQLRPAANLSISPRAQTKPVQPETGLPALACPRNATLVRNVSGKAEGPWNQAPLLGTYRTRAIINTGICKAGRSVHVGSRGLCWLVEECTLAPSPNDKGWFSAEKPLPSPPPASARVGRLNAAALVQESRTVANTANEPGEGPVQPGSGVIFRTA